MIVFHDEICESDRIGEEESDKAVLDCADGDDDQEEIGDELLLCSDLSESRRYVLR